MKVFLFLVLFVGIARAQTIAVAQPDGTYKQYVPQGTRTVRVHDTIWVEQVVHDTTERVSQSVTRIDTGRVSLTVVLPVQKEPAPIVDNTNLGIFGYSEFRGSTIALALSANLLRIRFFLYAGATYFSTTHTSHFTAGVAGFAPIF